MAGPFYVDDGGDGTTENSWATADTSINNLDAEYAFASNEIIYFGHDHVCQATNSASLTITGPTSGAPTLLISATQGSSPVTYAASTTNQIDTTEGAYHIIFDGSFALYGMCMKSGADISWQSDTDEVFVAFNTTFRPAANGKIDNRSGTYILNNCVIDLTADGTTNRSGQVFEHVWGGTSEFNGLTFVNGGYRTGTLFYMTGGSQVSLKLSGCDFSGLTQLATFFTLSQPGSVVMNNCITKSSPTFFGANVPARAGWAMITNSGPAHAPTMLAYRNFWGDVTSTTAITRGSGGTIEGTACALLIVTYSGTTESTPFYTPWQHEKVASTGSKTFDVYITNDTADFTDAEVWLEIEYLSTTDEALFAIANDKRATILTTAAAQTDDTTSTWSGTGPSYTYKQKLSVTATVAVAGLFRWRVAVAVASIASSRYFYVDPLVTVS